MFIELTDSSGNMITINSKNIISIEKKLDPPCAVIAFEKGDRVVNLVPMESYDEIIKRIK